MDITKTTHVSLCSGYGGIDLGLRRCIPHLRTVAYSEIEASAIEVLLARMEAGQLDAAPIWSDIKSFPWAEFSGRVDILSGGYPCQPFSSAGKRLGTEDPRHLWPHISAGIAAMRPRVCFFENVEGHISLGLREVIEKLESLGYKTTFGIFSAAEVGAPHQRKRVFILAVSNSLGGAAGFSGSFSGDERQSGVTNNGCPEIWPSRPGEPQRAWEPPRVVGNAESGQDNGREPRDLGEASGCGGCGDNASDCTSESVGNTENGDSRGDTLQLRPGEIEHRGAGGSVDPRRWQTESPLGGDAHGTASRLDYAELCVSCDNRTDELRLLGNGVVPATAERAFRTLIKELL